MDESPEERNRRSIYVFVKRNLRYPLFESFDMPDTHESCSRRNSTTSPLQALTMLNNKVSLEWAQAFAARVLERAGSAPEAQIRDAYRLAFSRYPSAPELKTAKAFLAEHQSIIKERLEANEPIALPAGSCKELASAQAAALVDFCHMLLNANEFVYLN